VSIEALFNHHVDVYRPLPPSDARTRELLGEVLEVFESVPGVAGSNCRPDETWSGTLVDHGPGEQQGNDRRWFLHRLLPVAERDVLDVTAGDNAPIRLRVLGVTKCANRRRLHHLEVNVEVWQGELALAVAVEDES
jgi:hypothetical protein